MLGVSRRLVLATAAVAFAAMGSVSAQEFPSKRITIVVPFPPGGNSDTVARLVADHVSTKLGQAVIVDNKPGGNGIVAANQVLQAPPDGHTLYLATDGQYAVNPHLLAKGAPDPMDRFRPVIQLVSGPLFLVSSPKLPVNNLADLIALAKTKTLTYGANDVRSAHYIISQLLQKAAGVKLRHIPYGGTAASIPDLISGRIDLIFGQSTGMEAQQSQGVKFLAVTTKDRSPQFPDVPTVAETFPGFDMSVAYGITAPKDTPDAAVRKLNAAFQSALEDPKIKETILASGALPAGGTAEAFGAFMKSKRDAFAEIVPQLDLKP